MGFQVFCFQDLLDKLDFDDEFENALKLGIKKVETSEKMKIIYLRKKQKLINYLAYRRVRFFEIINRVKYYDFFVYIVKCADDTLYAGYTTDLKKTENCSKLGAKYIQGRTPLGWFIFELYEETKVKALRTVNENKKIKKK